MSSQPQPASFSDEGTGFAMATFTQQNGTASDLYVTLSVPQQYGWGATGIGDQMAGARMFVVYPASNGQDVTLSIRTAPGQVMPTETDSPVCEKQNAQVVNNTIQATAICYGFGSYSGLTTNADNADWIFAVGPGVTVDSSDQDATIMQHSTHGNFKLNMAAAHRVAAAASSGASGPASTSTFLPIATAGPSNANVAQPISNYNSLVLAHSAIMGISFLGLFPLAVVLLRLVSVRMHYIANIFATIMLFIGFVIALVLSIYGIQYASFTEAHQIIGILVTALIIIAQLPGGAIGHLMFLKKGTSGFLGITHKYSGRVLGLLGSINAILGFLLSGDQTGAIAFGVFSLLVWVILIGFSEFWVRRQAKSRPSSGSAEQRITEKS